MVIVSRAGCGQQFAMPAEPRELLILGPAPLIEQRSVAGHRKAGLVPPPVADFRDDHRSLAAEFQTPRVERLRYECAIMHEQQRGWLSAQDRSIYRTGVGAQEHLGVCGIERSGTNRRLAWAGTRGQVQEVAAVGEKMRVTMGGL